MDVKHLNRLLQRRAHERPSPRNPLGDPMAHSKHPVIEFSPNDIRMIRAKFLATQKQFARLIGVSPETLRNWERGRRRPHGPARPLLRAIDADPFALARALNWYARDFKPEPEEWFDL